MYLQLSNYSIDSKTLELQLLTHPDFPSFKAVSDTYDYFGIENLVAKVPVETLSKLPNNFITLLQSNNDLESFLVRRKKDCFWVINQELKKQKVSFEKFAEIWDGTIIIIDENKNKSITTSLVSEKFGLLVMAIIGIVFLFFNNSVHFIVNNLLSVLGLFISYFIVKESFGLNDKAINKVCETISKKDGCGAVINDKNSKLLKLISLSDATIVYFSSNVFSIIILGLNYSVLFIVSSFSIPIVLYSLYYQGIILKKWCALCLGISVVLLIQFVLMFSHYSHLEFDLWYVLKFLFIVLFISFGWYYLKNLFNEKLKLESIEFDFIRFKRNQELFLTMLKKDKLLNNNLIPKESKITFGSEKPKIIIDAVTNPLCGFCVDAFQTYYKLLKTYGDEIQINFIFSVPTENLKHSATQIAMTVIDLYTNDNKQKSLVALNEWFEKRDFEQWSSEYGTCTNLELIKALKDHKNWVSINNIDYIPMTFINDYLFPKTYNISDIFLFIDNLISEKIIEI